MSMGAHLEVIEHLKQTINKQLKFQYVADFRVLGALKAETGSLEPQGLVTKNSEIL